MMKYVVLLTLLLYLIVRTFNFRFRGYKHRSGVYNIIAAAKQKGPDEKAPLSAKGAFIEIFKNHKARNGLGTERNRCVNY